jgi:hypothetical protein
MLKAAGALLLLIVGSGGTLMASSPHVIKADLGSSDWAFAARGPYQGRLDMRELYQIDHPLLIGQGGNFGEVAGKLTVPADWHGPIRLRFFVGDDYQAEGYPREHPEGYWFTDTVFVGHRFKQVLVNGEVVWERDVADSGGQTKSPPFSGEHYVVDLGQAVQPGQTFTLTLRLWDKVASDRELPDDSRYIPKSVINYWAGVGRKPSIDDPAVYYRFQTCSFWGDVALFDASVSEEEVAKATAWDWLKGATIINAALAADAGTPARGPIRLRLETDPAAQLPATGYPVRTGVPFARGMLAAGGRVELCGPTGEPVPVQTSVLTKWKDGSVKWLLLDFIAYPDCARRRYSLVWQGAHPAAAAGGVKIRRSSTETVIATGALTFAIPNAPGTDLLRSVATADGARRVEAITGLIDCRTQDADATKPAGPAERFVATRESMTVESTGPIRATVRIDGHLLDAQGQALGKLVMRVDAYAGLPYLHIAYRVFNNSGLHRRLDLSQLTLTSADGAAWAGLPETAVIELPPESARPDGILAQDGFGIGIRAFWQQFPKAIGPHGATLDVDLYHPIAPDSFHNWFAAGEAKAHELLLTLSGDETTNRRALEAFQDPPRLFDKEWHCQSGGWGPATWHSADQFPRHNEVMTRLSESQPATTCAAEYGIRNYGDMRFGAVEADGWCNNYYDVLQNPFAAYLVSGESAWFRRAEAMCKHLMDVDVVHDNPALPKLAGGVHVQGTPHHSLGSDLGTYDVSAKGYLTYYHLTGDPDALDTARGLVDEIVRSGRGLHYYSVREQAWPLTTLLAVYRETGDPATLQAATRIFEDSFNALSPRRGSYAEYHGTWNYVGNIPWMCGQMLEDYAMYWRETGDRRAAAALVGLASSLYCENMGGPGTLPMGWPDLETGPYGVAAYSHNPLSSRWDIGYLFLVNTGMACAYDLTGRHEFLDAAHAGFEYAEKHGVSGWGMYWHAPVLLFYLEHFRTGS